MSTPTDQAVAQLTTSTSTRPTLRSTRDSRLIWVGLARVRARNSASSMAGSSHRVPNTRSVGVLIYRLLYGGMTEKPSVLLLTGGAIWLTNVIVFALWYWEIDRGGPAARAHARKKHPDFLFAQMVSPELAEHEWEPYFVDYLYLSFTNATAFSPTDTLPLSRWAKLAMMFQSALSLATLALVVARAVNILT